MLNRLAIALGLLLLMAHASQAAGYPWSPGQTLNAADLNTAVRTKGLYLVLDYGAKGDGVTDDTASIQAAETAAEATSVCGTLIFPPGQYLIHTGPIQITKGGCNWLGYGSSTYNESAPYHAATLITDVASQGILLITNASLVHNGPVIQGINFLATVSTRTQVLVSIKNFMRGRIFNSSFRNGSVGIQFDGSGADMSDWVVGVGNIFNNNVIGIDCTPAGAGLGLCNNAINENYFNLANDGDIGIRCQHDNAQLRIIGNKFDGSFPSQTLMTTGVSTACNSTIVIGNNFENPSPAVMIPAGTTGSGNGRATIIQGNNVTLGSVTNSVGTLSCTTSNSSTAVTGCAGGTLTTLTGTVKVGMIVLGGNVNGLTGPNGVAGGLVYGTGAAGSSTNGNTVTGINTVAAIGSGTAFTLGTNTGSSGSGANTLTFCYPAWSFPPGWTYPVIISGNTYTNAGNCTVSSGGLQDGG